MLLCAVIPGLALSDNIRPAYLELEASPNGNIRVVWKVPLGQEIPPQFAPVFPDRFQMIPPRNQLKTSDAMVETWQMRSGNEGLAGVEIGINGLNHTTMDAMVRITFTGSTPVAVS